MENEKIPIDSKIAVTVTDKNMKASVKVVPPENGGRPVDAEMLHGMLEFKKIIYGTDEIMISEIAENQIYDINLEIASGSMPQSGKDGSLNYLFETKKEIRPKELSDGTVDYRELGLIQQIEEGQLLVEKTMPTDGVDGFDVFGNKLYAQKGKDPVLPAGKNTRVSEDGLQLCAEKAGHVEVINGKVTVVDTYIVKGDVSNATGNIDFNGNVTVNGNVLSGFVIKATGNINVRGSCEAATLKADGDIIIGDGMNGGKIEAGGEIKSKYLQLCAVVGAKNIYAGAVINCNLKCGASLILTGRKGTIVGGVCCAAYAIESHFIGSQNTYVPTHIEVGLDPIVQSRLQALPQEIEKQEQLVASLDRLIDLLMQYKRAGRLDDDKKTQLESAGFTRENEKGKLDFMAEEMAALREKVDKVKIGSVVSKGAIFPGVRVVIGPYKMLVKSQMNLVKLIKGENEIEVLSA